MTLSSLNALLLFFDDIEDAEDVGMSIGILGTGGNPSNERLNTHSPGLCIDH